MKRDCLYDANLTARYKKTKKNPNRTKNTIRILLYIGGERGIRTPGDITATAVFKTAAFGHSASSPQRAMEFMLRC